jgi:hypothetical protein
MSGKPVGNAATCGVNGRWAGGTNAAERNSIKPNAQIDKVVDDLKVFGHDADEFE